MSKDRVGKFLKDDQFIFYTLSELDEDSLGDMDIGWTSMAAMC